MPHFPHRCECHKCLRRFAALARHDWQSHSADSFRAAQSHSRCRPQQNMHNSRGGQPPHTRNSCSTERKAPRRNENPVRNNREMCRLFITRPHLQRKTHPTQMPPQRTHYTDTDRRGPGSLTKSIYSESPAGIKSPGFHCEVRSGIEPLYKVLQTFA